MDLVLEVAAPEVGEAAAPVGHTDKAVVVAVVADKPDKPGSPVAPVVDTDTPVVVQEGTRNLGTDYTLA